MDASCEDIDVDDSLSFLSGYVQSALLAGAAPYAPPAHFVDDDDDDDDDYSSNNRLNSVLPQY